jgi:hypothetical protein
MARDPAPSHHQDSSLPYSQAPAVSVRLLSTGTMKLLRLPIFSRRPPFVGLDGNTLAAAKDDVGSPKFPENPSVPMPCSQTPAEPWRLAFTAPWCCPPSVELGGPRRHCSFRSSITRPEHWLFTLRAAITGDDAKLASGGGQPFPGGIPVYPLSSVGKFPPFGLPFPWALLGAIYFQHFCFSPGCSPRSSCRRRYGGWMSGAAWSSSGINKIVQSHQPPPHRGVSAGSNLRF